MVILGIIGGQEILLLFGLVITISLLIVVSKKNKADFSSSGGVLKLLGNIVWLLFGGIIIAIEYFIASLILCITIIGIPFGIQGFKLAGLALWPFGKEIEMKEKGTGCLSTLMNLIWIFTGGIWISLTHVIFGLLFFITIIGIPFGKQHIKLASIALTPFGRQVVSK